MFRGSTSTSLKVALFLTLIVPELPAQRRQATGFAGLPLGTTSDGPILFAVRAGVTIEHLRCGGVDGPTSLSASALLLAVDSADRTISHRAVDLLYNAGIGARSARWRVSPYVRAGAGFMLMVKEGHPVPFVAAVALGATGARGRLVELSYHHAGNQAAGMRFLSLQVGLSRRVGSEPKEVCDRPARAP